jgi:hypothetical protein
MGYGHPSNPHPGVRAMCYVETISAPDRSRRDRFLYAMREVGVVLWDWLASKR